ncbi:MAG: biotin/lipoyl-containing protein, partial [Vagococcus sp.]
LEERWEEIKECYTEVNLMFGDIVKVTPSSKVVGDMALFMVQNNLTKEDIYEKGREFNYPESVISFFKGDLGQPTGGFPKELKEIILNGRESIEVRPGSLAKPVDFAVVKQELQQLVGFEPSQKDVISYIMYPQVFLDYCKMNDSFGDVELLDTVTFFQGMRIGETTEVRIEKGKTLIITLDQIGDPDLEGNRVLFFNLNGQRREIVIRDQNVKSQVLLKEKAEPTNKGHVAATMSGSVLDVLVQVGDTVEKGQALLITEAMKMETTIHSKRSGVVKRVLVGSSEPIQSGDLLIELTI